MQINVSKRCEICNMRKLKEYFVIAAGTFLLALGMNVFLVPARISSGGVGTIGTVLLHFFGIPLAVTNLFFNVILFVIGYKYLDRSSVIKTAFGVLLLSVFLQLTSYLPTYDEDSLICAVAGGILLGLGIGLVIRKRASTGGSDFAALVIRRFAAHISAATIILIIDFVIILGAGIAFGSVTVTFYSAIAMFITSKVADAIIVMGNAAKSVFIISRHGDDISQKILGTLGRGTTGIYSKGAYSGKNFLMLLCVVSPKELPGLVYTVRNVDSKAFIIISNAMEVLGEGFRTETLYDEIINN